MYMIPYTRRSNSSMMDLFDELERSMFGESGRRTPVFSTVLTISAKHQADDRTAADNYICRERRTGSFSRSFTLDGIQEDAIRASYQDGVLELILPKRQEVLPQCHKIQIQ